jgi:hypothetical protein
MSSSVRVQGGQHVHLVLQSGNRASVRVMDESGLLVPGVQIQAYSGRSATGFDRTRATDAQGFARGLFFVPGAVVVVVDGDRTRRTTCRGRFPESFESGVWTVRVPAGIHRLTGTVLSAGGPLAGVTVRDLESRVRLAKTSRDGSFDLGLFAPGQVAGLFVEAESFLPHLHAVSLMDADRHVQLFVQRGRSLRVIVTDEAGAAVPNAQVNAVWLLAEEVQRAKASPVMIHAKGRKYGSTDSSGEALLLGVPNGPVSVVVSSPSIGRAVAYQVRGSELHVSLVATRDLEVVPVAGPHADVGGSRLHLRPWTIDKDVPEELVAHTLYLDHRGRGWLIDVAPGEYRATCEEERGAFSITWRERVAPELPHVFEARFPDATLRCAVPLGATVDAQAKEGDLHAKATAVPGDDGIATMAVFGGLRYAITCGDWQGSIDVPKKGTVDIDCAAPGTRR